MERVEVTDLYQASFYLMNGCELLGVECVPTGNTTNCKILLSGSTLTELSQAWFEKSAEANLWAFRNAYSAINSHVQQAKRSFEIEKRTAAFRIKGGSL